MMRLERFNKVIRILLGGKVMSNKRLLTLFGIFCLIIMVGMPIVISNAASEMSIPKLMTFTAYEVGTYGYISLGLVGESIMDKYGIKIRILPSGTDIPRAYPVRLGKADVAGQGSGTLVMQEGLQEYASMEWGPQPIRLCWLAQHPGLVLGVRGNSDIYTLSDLKGRKVAAFPAKGQTLINEAFLAFAGLTWDDVEKVETPDWSAATEMVMEGSIDTNYASANAALMYEFDTRPFGLRLLPVPANDTEGWARMQKVLPYFIPFKLTVGAGVTPEKPIEGVSYPYPVMLAYDILPTERAYFITKAINETYSMFAPKNISLKDYWGIDTCLQLAKAFNVPLHEGSIRYFKEIGRWTDELETLNNERLLHQEKLAKLWQTTIDEALEKGMKSSAFPELWIERYNAEFGS